MPEPGWTQSKLIIHPQAVVIGAFTGGSPSYWGLKQEIEKIISRILGH